MSDVLLCVAPSRNPDGPVSHALVGPAHNLHLRESQPTRPSPWLSAARIPAPPNSTPSCGASAAHATASPSIASDSGNACEVSRSTALRGPPWRAVLTERSTTMSADKEGKSMSAFDAHRPVQREIEALYSRVARETEDGRVRQLMGVDRPVSEQEAEQALEDLFARWAGLTHAHRPTGEE